MDCPTISGLTLDFFRTVNEQGSASGKKNHI